MWRRAKGFSSAGHHTDPDHAAKVLQPLLENRELRKTMGNSSLKLVRAHYTWDRVTEMTEDSLFRVPGALSCGHELISMHPYTLIQLGMHSDASDGGVDRYFWGLNQAFQEASIDLDTRRLFSEKGTAQKNLGALGRADLPLLQRLFLLRKRTV